jgi:hypothetical protein
MGAVQASGGNLTAAPAFNNDLDRPAAQAVYSFCASQRLPLTVISRDAVPSMPTALIKEIAAAADPPSPLIAYLANAQSASLAALYRKICAGVMPPRCSKQWFVATFCDMSPQDRAGLWDGTEPPDDLDMTRFLSGTVKPYDPVTLLATMEQPGTVGPEALFHWESAAVRIGGTTHYVFDSLEHVQGDAIQAELEKALRSLSGRAKSQLTLFSF